MMTGEFSHHQGAVMMTGAFSRNVSKLLFELKLVTDNHLFIGYNQLFIHIVFSRPTSVDSVVIVVSLIALVLESTGHMYFVAVRPIKLARYT